MERNKIIQIISADGWYVVLKRSGETEPELAPLLSWALDTEGVVEGLVTGAEGAIEYATDVPGFTRYVYVRPGESLSDIRAIYD